MPRHVLASRPAGPVQARREDQDHRGGLPGNSGSERESEEEPRTDWSRQLAALRPHQVTAACLALIVVSLIWKAAFLSHYYFRQDDFQVLDASLKSQLTWGFLIHVDAGHFFPGVYAVAWVLSRVALYNWAAASGVVLVMIAAASLAAWRLLRTLLGNRPAALIPLALYLLAPLTFPNYSWWITAVEAIPLQISIFMSLNAHVHYVWTRQYRHALAAAGWLLFGLIFFEKSAIIPLLLFAVTAGFLVRRRQLLPAIWTTAVQLWKAWLLYFGLLAGYVVIFFFALRTSTAKPGAPSSMHAVVTFSWRLVWDTFLPGVLGGPWHWFHGPGAPYAYSSPPADIAWAALLAALALIAASILTRRKAWRAWAILAGWLVLADMLPVIIGRMTVPGYAGVLGMDTRYVADAAAVLAIVVALAFWPVAGRPQEEAGQARRQRVLFGGQWNRVAVAFLTVFTLGAVWSVQDLIADTTAVNKAYIANATQALAQVPAGTVIVDGPVPSTVMLATFKQNAEASVVLGPLAPTGSRVAWTTQPTGNIGILKIFGPDGRLYAAAIKGVTTAAASTYQYCLAPGKTRVVIPLPAIPPPFAGFVRALRIGYLANSGAAGTVVTMTYGQVTRDLTVMAGVHNAYFAVTGSAADVTLQGQSGSGAFCAAKTVAGYFVPLPGSGLPQASAG